MAYTITLSNGTALPVVLDGVTDTTSTSITLIGKNYVGYGAFLNQNFAKLLENFSNANAPANPLTGQIWWDSAQKSLKVYTGTSWKNLASSTVGTAAPSSPATGDQWFDTSVGQLKAWDGSAWLTIGPSFTSGQGVSGAIAETITDNLGTSHVVVRFYISGITVGILSKDATFTPSTAILGFSTIKPGMNLSTAGNFLFHNDANNALNLGGISAVNYARTDTATTFSSTVSVANNNGLTVGSSAGGDFSATVTSSAVNLKSNTVGKNLNLIAAGQTSAALSIASGTGLITVAADPVSDLGVATKQYVDNIVGSAISGSTDVLLRDGSNSVTGALKPDVTATRDIGSSTLRFAKIFSTSANIAGQVELSGVSSGIKFSDGTIQTTAATSVASGSITPDRLSAGGPYWLGNGNVGIGSSAPGRKLDVEGDGRFVQVQAATTGAITLRQNSSDSVGGHIQWVNNANTVEKGWLVVDVSSNMLFATQSTERMRITAAGDVGIATDTPATGVKLDVGGVIKATYPSASSQSFADQDITLAPFYTELAHSGSSYVPAVKIRTGGSARIRFSSFGSLHNTNGTVDTVIHAIDSNDTNNHAWRFMNDGTFWSPNGIRFNDGTVQTTASVITTAEVDDIWRYLSTHTVGALDSSLGYYLFYAGGGNTSRGTYYNTLITLGSATSCYESGEGGSSCSTYETQTNIGSGLTTVTVVNRSRRSTMRINLHWAVRIYTDDSSYMRIRRDGNVVYDTGNMGTGWNRDVSNVFTYDIPANSQSTFVIEGTIGGGSSMDWLGLRTFRTSLNAWI